MSLTPGSRLGAYEVQALVGSGGMGEVYRARDSKLGRDVAIKVLPEGVARDPERLARFEREARVLASLNHSNIAAIYGFEQVDGVPFLVLEYVPGPTLAERLASGGLDLPEILQICRKIAEALEEAHEKGIVHRDLKPANVKVTPDDKVKVLDFGLAKAFADDPVAADASHSPTMSALATRAGVIMGTAAYMSPEQVRSKTVDKRADIWAFGCVLYEMLTGKQTFGGETIPDTISAVLSREPDWSALPAGLPAGVTRLLRRCLQRDRDKRLRDIADARLEMEEALAEPMAATPAAPAPAARTAPSRSRLGSTLWITGTAVLALALAGVSLLHFRETTPPILTTRFQVLPPDKATSVEFPTISPDGRRLAFVTTVGGQPLLHVRPLDSLAAQALPGTDQAMFPFWSPDSRFLAFFSQGKLKKVDVSGGPPQTLCDAAAPGRGGSWNREGNIIFTGGSADPLRRVPASGGVPTALTTLDPAAERSHRWPHFLSDGRRFLYWVQGTDLEKSGIFLGSLEDKPDSKERRRILTGASMGVHSAGHLLFAREGILMAQPFDAEKAQLSGEPFPVAQQVGQMGGHPGWFAFSASPGGTLAYRTGGGVKTQLAWFDRAGKQLSTVGAPEDQLALDLSPDHKRVAVSRRDAQGQSDLALLDLTRDTSARFTFDPGNDNTPVWSPDGSRIVFSSSRQGGFHLYQKASSGAAGEELLLKSGPFTIPTDWSSDGRFILYLIQGGKTGYDLWVLPLEGDRKPFPYLQTEFNEYLGQFSPDGHWVAYSSTESTTPQIYVQGFPKSGAKFMVSINGGQRPRWRRDGKELFYLTLDRKMMAVEIKTTATNVEAGKPRELFQTRAVSAFPGFHVYDVTADGQRFFINTDLEAEGPPPMTVVMNWARGN